MMTSAPAAASALALSKPMPLVPPVTTKMRPAWEGMSAALQSGFGAGCPTVPLAAHAESSKAPTLAITDATLSEVSKLAERTLYYSSSSPAFVRSHVGLLSVLQALAFGLYARDAASYDDRIRAFKLK